MLKRNNSIKFTKKKKSLYTYTLYSSPGDKDPKLDGEHKMYKM